MLKSDLEERQKAIDSEFEKLDAEKTACLKRAQEIDQDLLRLQGAYRLLGDLIINWPSDKEKKPNGAKSGPTKVSARRPKTTPRR